MKNLVLILIVLLATACSRKTTTVSKTETYTHTGDSTGSVVKETLRLDTLTVPGDSAMLDIPLIPFFYSSDTAHPAAPSPAPVGATITGKKASIEVKVEGGRIKAKCLCKDEQVIIAAKDKEIQTLKNSFRKEYIYKTKTVTRPVPYVPKWAKVLIGIAAIISAVWIFRKGWPIVKLYLKSFKPF